MRLNFRALPDSLFARMSLILLAGLFVAQGISSWLQWDERAKVVSQARGLNFADLVADSVRVLESHGPSQQAVGLATLQREGLHVELVNDDQVSQNIPRGAIQGIVSARLGSPRDIRTTGIHAGRGTQPGTPQRSVDVRLQDGQWVRITAGREADGSVPALPVSLVLQLIVTLAIVTVAVMAAVRQATLPLQQLALAADSLGRDLDAFPLSEAGPTETRSAARAFNRMQKRIQYLIHERARALAAVSHDLRTPLTRLRLRAELVDDVPLREQIAGDLQSMAAMIDATLDYLRGLKNTEPLRAIDVNALLESMVEDARVIGRSIRLQGRANTPYNGRLSALQRALQNLIDNTIKYGQGAHIVVTDSVNELRIAVLDSGPGIPAADLQRVTEPYYRVDVARSSGAGGVGLGLSIAKDIAYLHGGELQLSNRAQGGLEATLILPRP
jgi:signal transduction histidine kinase